jgi:uncharacterized protein (TIGR00369 family)
MIPNKIDFAGLDALVRAAPFHAWLGVKLTALDEDGITMELPWREEFIAHPVRRYTHGGILAAFIDLAADYAIAAKLGHGVPTVDMRVDYHKAAMQGPIFARASVIRLGGTLATAEARITDPAGALLASGRGVYITLTK